MGFERIRRGGIGWVFGSRASSIAALLLLSLLWACEVLRADLLSGLLPNPLPALEGLALSFALLAVVAGLMSVMPGAEWPTRREIWISIRIGLGMFVVPAGLVYWANDSVSGFMRTALLTLVPVFAVVFEPYIGGDNPGGGAQQNRDGLLAALVAVIGAFCVFPVTIPGSIEAGAGIAAVMLAAASVAATNCAAVAWFAEGSNEARRAAASTLATASMAGATAALGIGTASLIFERPAWVWSTFKPAVLWSVAVELPGLLLLFWLLSRMSAMRMTTRYVVAPLMTVVIGALAMGGRLPLRTWLGLGLMLAGAAYLVLAGEAEEDTKALSLNQ